jgi:hypothetical protein
VTTDLQRERWACAALFVEPTATIGGVSVNTIQHLIDDLAAQLQRSVVVDDANLKLLYASKHYGDEDDVRRHAVLQRDAGAHVIGYVLSQGVATWTAAGVIPANEGLGLTSRVCVPIRWETTLLGFLMVVDREGTLTAEELSAITNASQELAVLMTGEHPPEVDADELALSEALDDLVAPEPAVRRAALRTLSTRLGDHADRHVRVVQLHAHSGRLPTSRGHIVAGFKHALAFEGARPAAWTRLTAVHERSALVLVTSRSEISDEAITRYANDLVSRVDAVAADRFTCVAGVGGDRIGLEHARTSFRQAEIAASAGPGVISRSAIRWGDLGELAVLLQLPLGQMDQECLPDELQRLLAYDTDGRSVETVQAFLDHAGSAPATADALHLHRTTLYYRLERIRDATGLDLDDGRTRLALHIGLRLRDLLMLQHGRSNR